jgi:hypothetical protein
MEMYGTVMTCLEGKLAWNCPIDRICGLDVAVYLVKNKSRVGPLITRREDNKDIDMSIYKEVYNLHIDWTSFYFCVERDGSCELLNMTFDTVELALTYLTKLMNEPFVDLLRCRISTTPTADQRNEYEEMKAFYAYHKNNEQIKFRFNECCVCYTLTETKTDCDHALCIACCQKIIDDVNLEHKYDEGEREHHPITCPMCRNDSFELTGY